jgi:Protein of unknown function (DUF1194)
MRFSIQQIRVWLIGQGRGKAARAATLAIWPFACPFLPALADTRTPVHIELLLALDCSASVDRAEFDLQLLGLAAAFRDPDVITAIEYLRPLGVAVGVMQWGGPGESRLTVPFARLATARDAKAFGFRLSRSRRLLRASTTSIATAIADGQRLLESNAFDGQKLTIDISGDGSDNSGLDLQQARRDALAGGVIVNGLPIESDDSGLGKYYREQVIIGADSFVEPALDFADYTRAIREKLLRELRPFES